MFLPSNITLKFGDSGDFVAELQRRLTMVQCFSSDQVNGFYDGSTVNGVMQFQGMNGLHADGVAGPETLRRLNGVIAGDSSTTEDKKEEEEKQLATRDAGLITMALAEQPQPGRWEEPPQREEAPLQEVAPPPPLAPPGLDPAMFTPVGAMANVPPPQEQAFLAQRDAMLQQQNPAQELSNLMQQQQDQLQVRTAPPPVAPPPMEQRPPELQSVARQADPLMVPPQPQPTQQAQPIYEPPAEQQQGGLVARAGRFANAMMQKLADYFEAKLPPSVMADVKAAGAVMAAAGMKEAPIPTGPEMGGPAQQLPARGPEQQPTQVRG